MSGQEYVILGALLIVFLIGVSVVSKKRYRERIRNMVREGYGAVPSREYTEEDFRRISRYYERNKEGHFSIDEITWNDLEMEELFMALNQTYSSVGESVLYSMLRTPEFDEETLAERERVIRFLSEHEAERTRLWERFAFIGRTKKVSLWDYIDNFTGLEVKGGFWHWLYNACLVISVLLAVWKPDIFIILVIVCIVNNLLQYYKKKAEVEQYFTCIDYVLQLVRFGEQIGRERIPELESYLKTLREASRPLASIKRKSALIGSTATRSGSLEDLILDYIRMLFHVDLIAFGSVLKQVKHYVAEVEALADTLGFLESCIAIASYRESLPYYALPELSHGTGALFQAEDLYHPAIEGAVPNSIREDGCVLLTGSNASGKSTFLKAAALCAIMAQTLMTVPASRYRAHYYRVYSSMALRDNLAARESYFVVEIKSLKRILDSVNEETPVLCFVDEVLRGTNTVERIAASAQILRSLAGRNIMCFAATHDVELTRLLSGLYRNYHFTEEISDSDIRFPYELKTGPAQSRNAIRLLSVMGYDPEITEAAEQTAARFLKTGIWSFEEEGK